MRCIRVLLGTSVVKETIVVIAASEKYSQVIEGALALESSKQFLQIPRYLS